MVLKPNIKRGADEAETGLNLGNYLRLCIVAGNYRTKPFSPHFFFFFLLSAAPLPVCLPVCLPAFPVFPAFVPYLLFECMPCYIFAHHLVNRTSSLMEAKH